VHATGHLVLPGSTVGRGPPSAPAGHALSPPLGALPPRTTALPRAQHRRNSGGTAHGPVILEVSTGPGALSCTGERCSTGRYLQDQRGLAQGRGQREKRGGVRSAARVGGSGRGVRRGGDGAEAALHRRGAAP